MTRTLCYVAFRVCLLGARCFRGSSVLCPVLVLRAFSWPDDISLCGQSTLGLSICLWMDIWAITSHASMNTRVQVSF